MRFAQVEIESKNDTTALNKLTKLKEKNQLYVKNKTNNKNKKTSLIGLKSKVVVLSNYSYY